MQSARLVAAVVGAFANTMTAYPKLIDIAGWALVILAGLIAIVAIVGAVSVLYSASPWGVSRMQQRLHEVYYVVYPHWGMAFVFLLCIVLAFGIGYLGYSQTRRSVERSIANSELDSAAKGSEPSGAER